MLLHSKNLTKLTSKETIGSVVLAVGEALLMVSDRS